MNDLRAGALRYLRFVLKELKLSPTGLAKMAGISSTTLTRFLNSDEHKFTLSTKTMQKIAEATGINPAPFLAGKNEPDIAKSVYYSSEVYNESWDTPDEDNTPQSTVVVGEASAGNWREVELMDIYKHPPLLIGSSIYRPSECFAVVVRGPSINFVAQDGDYLFCVRRDAMKRDFQSGDLVVVQKTSEDGLQVEVTAKRLKHSKGRWELWPESDDPRFKEPLVVDDLEGDDHIAFLGDVLYVVRHPR